MVPFHSAALTAYAEYHLLVLSVDSSLLLLKRSLFLFQLQDFQFYRHHYIFLPVIDTSSFGLTGRCPPCFSLRGPDKLAYAGFLKAKSTYVRKKNLGVIFASAR